MTLAPSRANALAMPRPMPLVDPVTSAVFPCNMIFPLRWSVGPGHTAEATDPSRLGRALEPDVLPRPPCIPVADLVMPPRRNLQSSTLPVTRKYLFVAATNEHAQASASAPHSLFTWTE